MQPIVFVTGKGGVGKSFASALLASKLALEGKKTLLVEMGQWSYLQKALDWPFQVGFEPQKAPQEFYTALWTGEECLRDYIQYLVKVPWLSESFLKNAWLRALIQVAPGLREIAFLGKLTSGLRQHGPPLDFDVIVVDAVSSGHFLSLLKTPKGLGAVAPRGPMRTQCENIQKILDDPQKTLTMIVSNLETYSVQESQELREQIQAEVKSEIHLVANKIYPVPVAPEPGALKQNLSKDLEEFLHTQFELGHFQWQQRELLSQQYKQTHTLWFYFEGLKGILKDGDEVERLF